MSFARYQNKQYVNFVSRYAFASHFILNQFTEFGIFLLFTKTSPRISSIPCTARFNQPGSKCGNVGTL